MSKLCCTRLLQIGSKDLHTVFHSLIQISSADSIHILQELAMGNITFLAECGFSKPVAKLDMTHKDQMIRCIILHKVILLPLAEMSQFREGLYKVEKMQEMMTKHSTLLEPFFCIPSHSTLTSGIVS